MKLFTSARRHHPKSKSSRKRGGSIEPGTTSAGKELQKIFSSLRLQQHADAFVREGILDVDDLKLVTVEDMKELGITKIGDRNRLKAWIDQENDIQQPVDDCLDDADAVAVGVHVDIKSCRRFFDCIDTEKQGSGELDTEMLNNAFKYIGCFQSEIETWELIQCADIDQSGSLNFTEFIHMLKTSTIGNEITAFSDDLIQCLDEIGWTTTNENDLLRIDITESTSKKTQRLACDAFLKDVPDADECNDFECNAAFDFIRSNPDLLTSLLFSGCTKSKKKLMGELENDEILTTTVGTLNMEAVVSNAAKIFYKIMHKQIHTFGLASMLGMSKSNTLDMFRMSAIFVACDRIIKEVIDRIISSKLKW